MANFNKLPFVKAIAEKAKKQKQEQKAKESGLPSWISKLSGSDKERAIRIRKAEKKD